MSGSEVPWPADQIQMIIVLEAQFAATETEGENTDAIARPSDRLLRGLEHGSMTRDLGTNHSIYPCLSLKKLAEVCCAE